MKIQQIYTGCLAQGAYYIESNGEVAIIDPLREVQPYIDIASANNAQIKYIFETHFHADFVSGHVTLAEKTGAPIVYGPEANPSFKAHVATDGEVFKLGEITITCLHTPGHTMESSCYLLKDKDGKDYALFSGDTLFLGDVGRPDLAQKAAHMTQEQLAGVLFDSLRTKIMPLADDVIVYPAHGAGSACGKNLSKETVGSIGEQKATNYALRANMTRDEFIAEVTDGLLPPPAYFPMNVKLNKEGYANVEDIISEAKPFDAKTFELVANETEALILDVRHQDDFAKGHIPKSIFIGIDGQFAPWVGALILDIKQPILLVTPVGKEQETIMRLARVGYDNTVGYLKGGFESWKNAGLEFDTVTSVSAEKLDEIMKQFESNNEKASVFDVRKPGEYAAEHILDVPSTPLDFINDHLSEFPKEDTFYVHCAGGYRSMIAASILKSRGYHNVVDVLGGFSAIKKTEIKTTNYVCPSTLK
ncbi:MBL fold metallo-hydrolase [Flavobacterium aquatile]|uniref:Beta-lactamase n=1 Tax=Flavobacterium aquatile LMG 4008 = ATCC 11947 TaxID=1453498 RepID=A0A095SVC6_9FLAO|nr:rhodanese-like domain-containing protein [Flavobacterium aquatile]KGD68586.1 beta-lactamase [Flavobacterium aquatile LMG 4008 = ATCC 11947]OXA68485.1 MBL fold metallo-hydrolase [Flavobacterium aquatile LMG 4008 = ATCC 11947]GEC79713.1 MBL fold metallo-hydrolase [Flavobacterium aquatile]